MKKSILFTILIFWSSNIFCQKVYDFDLQSQQAYKDICQLKIESAVEHINKAKQTNPNNLIPIYLESYIDLIELFFNEDLVEYKKRKDDIDERISQLKKGNKNSALYQFCLSNAYLHKSIIHVRYDENLSGAWAARKAFMLIKDNKEEFKTFSPNDMLYGSLQAITGTIPKSYNWIASILGMKGSIKEGMKNLKSFVKNNDSWGGFFSEEATFYYTYLAYYIENKKEETLDHIQNGNLDLVNNHLFAFMATNIGINGKKTDFAKSVILNRNKSSEYLQTSVWDMQMGFAKLHKLELNEAIAFFEKYLSNFKGNFYLKDIYQKLSWAYYLQGNLPAAQHARALVISKGGTNSDADKQALKEAKENTWPNTLLLKARLLNDGGYNTEALKLLNNKTLNNFEKTEEKLEFVYRLARIYDDNGNDEEAINYYKKAIEVGSTRKEYFAARSALQTGLIYEKQANKTLAIQYFNQCIAMDDHDYKSSLDQKAKSGISRCKGE